jgi:transcription elongation factor GreA
VLTRWQRIRAAASLRAVVSERRADDAPARDGEAEIGERVTVLDLKTSLASDYRVVASYTARPAAGEISHRSPLGAALLGRHVGDIVEIAVRDGVARLEVVEIDG